MTAIIVSGDREWKDRAYVFERLDEIAALYDVKLVIEGCARGADRCAGWPCPSVKIAKGQAAPEVGWAEARGIPHRHFAADWTRYGNAAGPVRNRDMLAALTTVEDKRLVVAFHTNLQASKGTKDMVTIARTAGIETFVFPHSHEGYRPPEARNGMAPSIHPTAPDGRP